LNLVPDINKENIYGETPLFHACLSGNNEVVKYLIEQGADLNKVDSYYLKPIIMEMKQL